MLSSSVHIMYKIVLSSADKGQLVGLQVELLIVYLRSAC